MNSIHVIRKLSKADELRYINPVRYLNQYPTKKYSANVKIVTFTVTVWKQHHLNVGLPESFGYFVKF